MIGDAGRPWIILLLGIASTTQTHLAKAMERQGIETWDLILARLRRTEVQLKDSTRKPTIYVIGLILNHTTFLWHLLVAPLGGHTALYTSMFGVGLLVLLAYSTWILREPISRRELGGALLILVGTLLLGMEGVGRPTLEMGRMNLADTGWMIAVLLALCLGLVIGGLRSGSPRLIGLSFGLSAGTCGALDPFLKAVGQTAGGGAGIPGSTGGWVAVAFSFPLGETAVLLTQWGFYRRARANILVPALNSSYVAVPVLLQAILLPGYELYTVSLSGLAFIVLGFALMRGYGRVTSQPSVAEAGPPAVP